MLEKTISVVLAGGVVYRLAPLTHERAKPAVPFGGKYRIIDFCLANCMHSGLRKILVLTQYKSHSLHKHLRDGWSVFNPELREYITTIPPQMRTGGGWYSGTADAIYQNMYLLERSGAQWVVVLSGDHIYRMDYAAMLKFHIKQQAAATVACMEVPIAQARAFGVMSINNDQRVTAFAEKPEHPTPVPGDAKHALSSMGIYVFSIDQLSRCLQEDARNGQSSHDFGKDILPKLIEQETVMAYRFGGAEGRVSQDQYWRDVGTLDAYYEANMDLLNPTPALNLYQNDWPIRTYQGQHPPARTVPGASGTEGICINSIVAGGVIVSGGSVQHSIIFPHVEVGDEAFVQNSILFSGVKVGKGARLRNCIVDKHVSIPANSQIGFDEEQDSKHFTLSEKGIVVVPKGYTF